MEEEQSQEQQEVELQEKEQKQEPEEEEEPEQKQEPEEEPEGCVNVRLVLSRGSGSATLQLVLEMHASRIRSAKKRYRAYRSRGCLRHIYAVHTKGTGRTGLGDACVTDTQYIQKVECVQV